MRFNVTAGLAFLALSSTAIAAVGCNHEKDPAAQTTTGAAAPITPGAATPAVANANAGERAEVGKPAPDFTLKDLDGKDVRLSSFKGKTVVLEWFNPGCPFVKASHTKGSLKDAATRVTKNGTVWLAINSGAPGKQGAGAEANRDGAKTFSMPNPILLDEAGTVGKMYGATNTPHVMIVDDKGTLVYRGAVDNSPDGEGESPTGGKLVSYVDATLADLAAGRPVATAETKAYGCGVKYGH